MRAVITTELSQALRNTMFGVGERPSGQMNKLHQQQQDIQTEPQHIQEQKPMKRQRIGTDKEEVVICDVGWGNLGWRKDKEENKDETMTFNQLSPGKEQSKEDAVEESTEK